MWQWLVSMMLLHVDEPILLSGTITRADHAVVSRVSALPVS